MQKMIPRPVRWRESRCSGLRRLYQTRASGEVTPTDVADAASEARPFVAHPFHGRAVLANPGPAAFRRPATPTPVGRLRL